MVLSKIFGKKPNKTALTTVDRYSLKSRISGKEYYFYTATDSDGNWYAMTEPANYIFKKPDDKFCIPCDDEEDARTKGMAMMNLISNRDDKGLF